MKRLEDIPKKEIFTVPDGYFENLPSVIQARIANEIKIEEKNPAFGFALKYALPAVVILIALTLWFRMGTQPVKNVNAESLLASIQTEDLVAYLNESDLTTDEVLESVEFNADDLDEIEESVYEIVTGSQLPATDNP